MMFPIVAYGHPVLRKKAVEIEPDFEGLPELIDDLLNSMYESDGLGLAAPQINKSIRLFVIDASPLAEKYPEAKNFKKVFVNPYIIDESGDEWAFKEGCLSIPDISEEVYRQPNIKLQYQDMEFNNYEENFGGVIARIIQHEYDHLEGVLFVDRINPLRKTLLKKKLNDITKGNINVDYKMIFPAAKKKKIYR